MALLIMKGDYGAIDADDCICHGYCNIKFSSSPHTLQADLIIYGQVIFPVKWYAKEHISQ